MEKSSKKYYYRVDYELQNLQGHYGKADSALLTEAEFQALKQHYDDFRFWAKLDDDLESEQVRVSSIKYSAVTKRYYKKHFDAINREGYGTKLINELDYYLKKESKNKTEDLDEDEERPYHEIECRCNVGSKGSTFFVVLTDQEFWTFKQYHDPKTSIFVISTSSGFDLTTTLPFNNPTAPLYDTSMIPVFGLPTESYFGLPTNSLFGGSTTPLPGTKPNIAVCIESWKESEITPEDYKLLITLHNRHGCSVKLLEKIESWIGEAEKAELEGLPRGTITDPDQYEYKHEEEEEADEDDDIYDEDDEREKPLEKKVKRGYF